MMGNPSYKITSNHSKKSIECALKSFSKTFFEYIRMEYPSYENGNIERKYLSNIRKNLKQRELKDRKPKIKREIEELFLKTIVLSTDDMDKFEQKEIKKIKLLKALDMIG